MKIIKKAVKIELILISLFFIILLIPLLNTADSSNPTNTNERTMFMRTLNYTNEIFI